MTTKRKPEMYKYSIWTFVILVVILVYLELNQNQQSLGTIPRYKFIPQEVVHINYEIPTCDKTAKQFKSDIDSALVFPSLGFNDSWIAQKWFWNATDFNFEARFETKFKTPQKLRVFVVPHSHSDPGWLKTFEGYFENQTRHTLDYAVEKLALYKDMTFIWSEVIFLSKWWKVATEEQRNQFREFVKEGRLEILTGGWIMTDEATVNLYSMIDQLIEGRQWVKSHIGIEPSSGWSVDPFGHGSAMPYLLKSSGIDNMVIQRIHYGWKKYFGQNQNGNFQWIQRWDVNGEHGITCHNVEYDIYTTKHTCGPITSVCLKFDFRNVPGEYSEYMRNAKPLRSVENVSSLISELIGQFQRTASLGPSNVVLFPLGDDFRFDRAVEWDQQYENYVQIMNYINERFDQYGVEISFGTVSDYFKVKALHATNQTLQSFSGDFFPYSDVYISGRPAYWTGYFGSRPYWKKFYRETEANLRSAEILFSYAFNLANNDPLHSVILGRQYQHLVEARRHLALFAHHDATTGTSPAKTMEDYGQKLFEAERTSIKIQKESLKTIMVIGQNNTNACSLEPYSEVFVFGKLAIPQDTVVYDGGSVTQKILLFNNLGFKTSHLVRVRVTSNAVKVLGPDGENVESQINPIVNLINEQIHFENVYELTFLAELKPLTLHTFEIQRVSDMPDKSKAEVGKIVCRGCEITTHFEVQQLNYARTIMLSNSQVKVNINGASGMLQSVTQGDMELPVKVEFGGYQSIMRESGAYLMKVDLNKTVNISNNDGSMLVVDGPVMSYVTAFNQHITTTTWITKDSSEEIHVENIVDMGRTTAEVYMRVDTLLNSTSGTEGQPAMYTDQSGFTFEKRVKVPQIGYQGNHYPVSTMAYLQDEEKNIRFSILVDRAHGFSVMEPGRLETLIERVTMYDDGRGMSEGVTDNKRTVSNYIFLIEKIGSSQNKPESEYNLPSLNVHRLSLGLSYPPNQFGYEDDHTKSGIYHLFTKKFPEDTHLINLRTMSSFTGSEDDDENPSKQSLMLLQKLGYSEPTNARDDCSADSELFKSGTKFNGMNIEKVEVADLTGNTLTDSFSTGNENLPTFDRSQFEITSLVVTFANDQTNIEMHV